MLHAENAGHAQHLGHAQVLGSCAVIMTHDEDLLSAPLALGLHGFNLEECRTRHAMPELTCFASEM
jgi:hypothetical protein